MKHTITNRIIIGKTIGLIAGALVFFIVPAMGAELDLMFGLGLWLLYITLGAFTALLGIMDRHPILNFKMPFWVRGIAMGLCMHLLLILLAYDQIQTMILEMNIFGLQSPWWALIDGAILGLLMGWAETKFAGEGNLPLK